MDKLLSETIALIKAHGYKVYAPMSLTTYAWYTDGTRVVYFQVSSMDGLTFYSCHHPNPKWWESDELYPEVDLEDILYIARIHTLWTPDGLNKEFLEKALEDIYPGAIRMTLNDLIYHEAKSGHPLMEVMEIYISPKNKYHYIVYKYSTGNRDTKDTINGVIRVLQKTWQAKIELEDGKKLQAVYAKDRNNLLLFIEKNPDGSIKRRFAVDLTK